LRVFMEVIWIRDLVGAKKGKGAAGKCANKHDWREKEGEEAGNYAKGPYWCKKEERAG
jgi:hypothetical protein